MDCAEERTGGEEISTDSSLNFYCKWNQRNGIGYEIRGEFQIGDIRTSLYTYGNSPLETEKLTVQEREVIFTEGKLLGRGEEEGSSFS